MPERIEVFNTNDGMGHNFINIRMPVEAAKEMQKAFEDPSVTNPKVAEALDVVIYKTSLNKPCTIYIEKGQ